MGRVGFRRTYVDGAQSGKGEYVARDVKSKPAPELAQDMRPANDAGRRYATGAPRGIPAHLRVAATRGACY